MVDFVTNYLDSARQMCNVNLISKNGSIIKSHALLLASVSKLMKTLILDAFDSDEVVVIILPDFNDEEVQQGLEEIIRGKSLSLHECTLLATLGIRKFIKDVKGEPNTFPEKEEDTDFHEDLLLKDEQASDNCSETEYPIPVKEHVCPCCNKQFSSQKRLTCHLSIEHELKTDDMKFDHTDQELSMNDEEKYRCNYCEKRFVNETNFSNHMSRKHENMTDYHEHIEEIDGKWICKVCGKNYPKKNACIQHWRKVHNKLKSKLQCHVCNKELSNKWNLKLHMKMHTGKRDFICDTCGSGFLDKKVLDQHHVRLHGSEQEKELKKTHVCSTCGKGFWNKTSLTTHEDVHLEGNNFICDQCECTFKTSNALRIHTNRIHLGKWVLTEEQRAKQNLRKRKFRAEKKAKNGGMLRTPEEKAVFNEYMRNYMARRKAAAKDTVVRQLNM